MAIINNNVQNVQFLRNQSVNITRQEALALLDTHKNDAKDGSALLARYTDEGVVKTLVGYVYVSGDTHDITVIDVQGSGADVEALRQEINKKLGSGITSANTATAQLEALSGATFTAGTSNSGDTSVEGAKAYAYDLIGTLDYTDTAETGSYVSKVDQVDGKITTTKVALPTVGAISESGKPITAVSENLGQISASAGTIEAQYVTATGFTATDVQGALEEVNANIGEAISGLDYSDSAVAKNFVKSVSETDGVIAVERGSITSSGETIVLTDNADGGVNFEVHYDGTTIIQDPTTKELKVASSALVQYAGDEDTIHITDVVGDTKTVSSLLSIKEVTTSVPDTVAHRYILAGTGTTKIGEYIDIPKDSALVNFYLGHVDDLLQGTTTQTEESTSSTVVPGTGDTALVWIMQLSNGKYKLTAVDVHSFIDEAEFASGVTWDSTAKKVKGVVDGASEGFLTVGADGFKLAGVQNAIDTAVSTAVEALDADVSGNTTHVTVNVVEADGVITGVNVAEDNIANANDLAALSAKTVTEVGSSNTSISATTEATADGTVSVDLVTDASKIKMSGFTSTDALSGINSSSSITEAFKEVDNVITHNEEVTAAALTDLDGRLDVVEDEYISGVSVNGNAVTVANKVAPISITAATSAATATSTEAIVVNTDANGNITLGLSCIDCGYYA